MPTSIVCACCRITNSIHSKANIGCYSYRFARICAAVSRGMGAASSSSSSSGGRPVLSLTTALEPPAKGAGANARRRRLAYLPQAAHPSCPSSGSSSSNSSSGGGGVRRAVLYADPDADAGADLGGGERNWSQGLVSLSVASFNLLAPCYKRVPPSPAATAAGADRDTDRGKPSPKAGSVRESHSVGGAAGWRGRAEQCVAFLRADVLPAASLVALQEFWGAEEAYRGLFAAAFEEAGFQLLVLQRPGSKADSVAVAVRRSVFEVLGREDVRLGRLSDRVALLLWLRVRGTGVGGGDEGAVELVVADTHLSYPHTLLDRLVQGRQVARLTQSVEAFAQRMGVASSAHRMVLGDFNAEADSAICSHLRGAGYVSCFDAVHPTPHGAEEEGEERNPSPHPRPHPSYVSHRTHEDDELGVDHLFLRPATDSVGGTGAGVGDGAVYVEECSVLPRHLPFQTWQPDFSLSDHRPVCARILLPTPTHSPVTGAGTVGGGGAGTPSA